MSFLLFVAFISPASLILSVSHWLSLSLTAAPLFSLLWVARSRFPFHFCHRQSPSHSWYTWLNIGPQMIIKPSNPQACKLWVGLRHRLLPPVCPLFPRSPSCLETLVPAWSHCVFVFIPKSSIPQLLLPDVCFRWFKTEAESKREREEIVWTQETERGLDIKNGKISICEKYQYRQSLMCRTQGICIFSQTSSKSNPS